MRARLTGVLTLALALSGLPAAAQPEGCSVDTLRVDDVPLEVSLCVATPAEGRRRDEGGAVNVGVTERFTARGESFSRAVALEFMAGGQSSRSMDDVSLQKLGFERTLHLTILYRQGHVRLEHAMLLPGAVTLK